jgi:hypothetical protein
VEVKTVVSQLKVERSKSCLIDEVKMNEKVVYGCMVGRSSANYRNRKYRTLKKVQWSKGPFLSLRSMARLSSVYFHSFPHFARPKVQSNRSRHWTANGPQVP